MESGQAPAFEEIAGIVATARSVPDADLEAWAARLDAAAGSRGALVEMVRNVRSHRAENR